MGGGDNGGEGDDGSGEEGGGPGSKGGGGGGGGGFRTVTSFTATKMGHALSSLRRLYPLLSLVAASRGVTPLRVDTWRATEGAHWSETCWNGQHSVQRRHKRRH